MATVEYDLDTSGGLMEEIQKLVAPPPSNDDFSRRPRRRVREYRKGRAVNHDCCDSCKEGGDLLCCDQCPAAFHLQCHDPPLEEDDLPSGEWICHRCRVGPPQEVKEESSATPTLPAPKPSTSRSRGRRKSLEEPMEVQGPEEEDVSSNPLKMLAKAARLMNPVQFDLPKDIACTTALPGSSKRRWGREGSRGPPKKLAHELDNGIVPLPAKLCFVCNKSCKKAPLIQCDYCPLLFHMDCLNPPLTSLPSGRWMCPNHAENCLDEGLLKSTSLSERVRLWDHYAPGQINQHAAKVEFLKKVHRHNPPFRIKVKHPKRKTVMVPQVIKDNYANPPALLPRPCSHVTVPGGDNWKGSPSLEDQEEWLSSVVSLQTSIAKYLAQKQLNKSPSASVGSPSLCATLSSSDVLTKPTASVSPVVHTGSEETSSTTGLKSTVSGTCVASENETVSGSVEEEERTKVNGPLNAAVGLSECDSPDSMTLPNGPVDKSTETVKTGAISLLNHTPNGDIMSWQNTEAMVVKTRSNSIDSSSLNIAKSRLSGDRSNFGGNSLSAGSPSSLIPATTPSKGKNIVISAINKANNTVITKVVSGSMPQAGKPLTNSATGKAVGNSNSPTSILSPRTANSSSRTISNTQTANKVITVSTSTPGIKSSVNSSSSVSSGPSAKVSSLSSSPAIANLNSTLQSCIEGNGEMELGKLDERLVQILAWQRLQQLLPSKPQSPPSSASIPAKKGVLNGLLSHQGSCEVQARALLCPLTGKGQPISMPYRTLNIGTGADMDVCLNSFGTCNFISAKHAVIFYDETSKHFELLNYSEHGTTVDNVLYSCDFSEKTVAVPEPCPIVSAVRGVIKKGRKKKVEKEEKVVVRDRVTMSGGAYKEQKTCSCKGSSSSLIGGSGAGWEGTALLHHGSYIKVGCLQFVFSIVEQAPLETKPLDRRRESRESVSLLKPQFRTQKSDH